MKAFEKEILARKYDLETLKNVLTNIKVLDYCCQRDSDIEDYGYFDEIEEEIQEKYILKTRKGLFLVQKENHRNVVESEIFEDEYEARNFYAKIDLIY